MSGLGNPKRIKGKGRRDIKPKGEQGRPDRIDPNIGALAMKLSRFMRPKARDRSAKRQQQPWKPGDPK